MGVSRRNHTVPRTYLARFASDVGKLVGVDLPGKTPFVTNIKDASVVNNFYTVTDWPEPPDFVEHWMNPIEAGFAEVRDAMESGEWPLSADHRHELARFIALQFRRGPNARRLAQMAYEAQQLKFLILMQQGRIIVLACGGRRQEEDAIKGVQVGQAGGETIDVIDTAASFGCVARRGLVRARHGGRLTAEQERSALRALSRLRKRSTTVTVTDAILEIAGRPFPAEPIRTLDAVHLATVAAVAEAPQFATVITRGASGV